MPVFAVDAISLDALRLRRSAKWQYFDADVLPAWVAEMDFPLAEPIARALHAAIDNSDTGYLWTEGLGEAFAHFAHSTRGWQVPPTRASPLPDVLTCVAQSLVHLTALGDGVMIKKRACLPPVLQQHHRCRASHGGRGAVGALA